MKTWREFLTESERYPHVKEDAMALLRMSGIREPHDPAIKNLQYADDKVLFGLISNLTLTDEFMKILDYLRM